MSRAQCSIKGKVNTFQALPPHSRPVGRIPSITELDWLRSLTGMLCIHHFTKAFREESKWKVQLYHHWLHFQSGCSCHEISLDQLNQHVATETKVTWWKKFWKELTTWIRPENIGRAKNMALRLALIDSLIRLERIWLTSRLSKEYPSYLHLLLHGMVCEGQTNIYRHSYCDLFIIGTNA